MNCFQVAHLRLGYSNISDGELNQSSKCRRFSSDGVCWLQEVSYQSKLQSDYQLLHIHFSGCKWSV